MSGFVILDCVSILFENIQGWIEYRAGDTTYTTSDSQQTNKVQRESKANAIGSWWTFKWELYKYVPISDATNIVFEPHGAFNFGVYSYTKRVHALITTYTADNNLNSTQQRHRSKSMSKTKRLTETDKHSLRGRWVYH